MFKVISENFGRLIFIGNGTLCISFVHYFKNNECSEATNQTQPELNKTIIENFNKTKGMKSFGGYLIFI